MRILVTGGAGYIGSVIVEELVESGHEVIVYDNLSKGHRDAIVPGARFVHAELLDRHFLEATLTRYKVEAVMHMAADSLVSESVQNPAKYYDNNLVAGMALLEAMRRAGTLRLVFSSSAAVYGESGMTQLSESAPAQPTNP